MSTSQKDIKKAISEASKIALCIGKVEKKDQAYALVSFLRYLEENKKEVSVLSPNEPSEETKEILKENSVSISQEAKPLSYVITFDYAKSGIDKITWDNDEDKKKIKFFIVPSNGQFSFDDVQYDKEGFNYDLTLTLGIKSFKDMGKVYDNSDYLFKENKVICIAEGVESLGDMLWEVSEGQTLSDAVFELIKDDASDRVLNILLSGKVNDGAFLEGGNDEKFWVNIGDIAKRGGNVDKMIKEKYFSKSYQNLDLQIKMMHNVKVDREAKVIWSSVSKDDIKYAGLDKENLDYTGRIIFNISEEFDLAVAVYEIEKDTLDVLIESNNTEKYSAVKIANVFGGNGKDTHAKFTIENMALKNFEKRFFSVLQDIYKLDIRGETVSFNSLPVEEVTDIEKHFETLTNAHENSKNAGSISETIGNSDDSENSSNSE